MYSSLTVLSFSGKLESGDVNSIMIHTVGVVHFSVRSSQKESPALVHHIRNEIDLKHFSVTCHACFGRVNFNYL